MLCIIEIRLSKLSSALSLEVERRALDLRFSGQKSGDDLGNSQKSMEQFS